MDEFSEGENNDEYLDDIFDGDDVGLITQDVLSPLCNDFNETDEDASPIDVDIRKLIVHMFLPKKTPGRMEDDLQQIERSMLSLVSDSIRKAIESCDFTELTPVHNMMDTWLEAQSNFFDEQNRSEVLRSQLEGLVVGNTVPIYIRQQNCVMMISKVEIDGKVKVRAQIFRASLPSNVIMSSVHSLKMNFPEASYLIENERMLSSRVYASQLIEMATKRFDSSTGTFLINRYCYTDTSDGPQPFLGFEWSVGVLVPREDPTCPSITKKIRDQVSTGMSLESIPFRRSGMWMSIKVALQLKVLEVLGGNEEMAKLVYKIVMLQIFADVCKVYEKDKAGFDMDLASQMLAKVGRRVEKLRRMSCGEGMDAIAEQIELMRSSVLDYTLNVLTSVNKIIQRIWNKVAFPHGLSFQPIHISIEQFQTALLHKLTSIDGFLDKARQQIEKSASTDETNLKAIQKRTDIAVEKMKIQRCFSLESIFSTQYRYDCDQKHIWRYDMEKVIKGIKDDHTYTSEQIFDLGKRYIAETSRTCKNNPLGFSQMLLVSLKLASILDKIATTKHPILSEYKPDIKASSFDCLLLPFSHDMDLLKELLYYFSSRDTESFLPILERKIHDKTLSVRFAENNEDMMALKAKIKLDIQEAIQLKFKEWEKAREDYHDLARQLDEERDHFQECSCEYTDQAYVNFNGILCTNRVKISTCKLCSIKHSMERKITSVRIYEIPFPPDHQNISQNAVVFELMIPTEIFYLRQFLAILKYELLGEPLFGDTSNEVKKHWLDYTDLLRYRLRHESCINNLGLQRLSSTEHLITLGSTALPFSSTRTSNMIPNILMNPKESYVADNGMNCHFHYTKKRIGVGEPVENFIDECTFSLNTTGVGQPYLSLQKYLSSTEHSQNEVIANQSECDPTISLDEYMAFGSLRAGHRAQLRNLYRAISSRSLPLDKEPVLALILQTIWQVGPRDENGIYEAHLDFKENDFAMQFLELLEELVKSKSQNYSTPLVLFTAIVIAGRIMELNEYCRNKCYQLLQKWRELTDSWCAEIEKYLRTGDTATSEPIKDSMRKILIEVKMCSVMTYNVHCADQSNNVCKDDDDMEYFLNTLYSKNLAEKESDSDFSRFMQVLRIFERMVPVRLDLDRFIGIGNEFQRDGGVKRFIEGKVPAAKEFGNYEITMVSNNIIKVQPSTEHVVVLNTITGELLINGYSENKLSSEITRNVDFKRFFQKHLFRVQRKPNDVQQTSYTFHGKHYEFRRIARNVQMYRRSKKSRKNRGYHYHDYQDVRSEEVYIIEMQEDQPRLVLVPHQEFGGLISDMFIDNYTHWMDPISKCIYFRRIPINESDYDLPYEYVLKKEEDDDNVKGWILQDEVTRQFLVSIKSVEFTELTRALSRLELAKHINLLMDNEKSMVGAHLTRHNLRFTLHPNNGLLESSEYPGFQLSLDQNAFGTLIGLENGLLLKNGIKRIIIIPHGSIKMSEGNPGNGHHRSEIDLESLSQPSFFIYEFDDVLKRVVAKKSVSAWLYLAALHAVTSSSQPDPFTRITGTEMAVQILQSAIVWSCSPYSKESLEILKFIKGLTPFRMYYGHWGDGRFKQKTNLKEEIEMIQWPATIPTMAAYDGYALLVNDLIRDSVRLIKIHPIKKSFGELYDELMKQKYSEKLLLRAYLRNSDKYNDEVRLHENVIKRLDPNLLLEKGFTLTSRTVDQTQKLLMEQTPVRVNPFHIPHLRRERLKLEFAPMLSTAYFGHLCHDSLLMALKGLIFRKNTLSQFVLQSKHVLPKHQIAPDLSLERIFGMEFSSHWLRFYHLATSKSEIVDSEEFTNVLSALTYCGVPLEQINILLCIRTLVDSGKINFPPVLELPNPLDPSRYEFNETEIAQILKKHSKHFPQSFSGGFVGYVTAEERDYRAQIANDCTRIAKHWKSDFWPCAEISKDEARGLLAANINESALDEANKCIQTWFYAREFRTFLDTVQNNVNACLDSISTSPLIQQQQVKVPSLKTINSVVRSHERDISSKISINCLMDQDVNDLVPNVEEMRLPELETEQKENYIPSLKQFCEGKIKTIENAIFHSMSKTVGPRIIQISGLGPRLNPVNLLKTLLNTDSKRQNLNKIIGSIGVLWTHLKRFNRCLHLQQLGKQDELAMELRNPGHENWSPIDRPEWLLIELELDITIRKVQVEVANQMIRMPDDGNGVMQMNMGEGKTSVIVPMLCSILGTEDSFCRVTVLSSIFKMNWDILKFAIGGLLNRRLYSFPFRRDMKIDEGCVSSIQAVYEECMKMRGVVLTLPEYRLSFRSLAYDKLLKKETTVGLKLLQSEDWLRWHARDILDESDELLSVKYQLVYTIGEQIDLDGGEVRWMVCQQILDIIQDIAPNILETHGTTRIEYDMGSRYPHEFSPIRLIAAKENEEFYKTFERLVTEKYLEGVTMSESQMKLVTEFLNSKELSSEAHANAMDQLKKDPMLANRILTLAGYIHRGVLRLALSKRWRVEFGVDQKCFRRMAVPFRAKDVAAERTEFGHPDLAIILTHLSYYYSGLSDSEMEEVFSFLMRKLDPGSIYNMWIEQIPEELVAPSLSDFHSLNLKDGSQKLILFDLIRKHKMVVNFWLSHVVFPKESKQFPGKLAMTASDLVYERQRLPITGFSGTNDSILLLPLTINQQDLPLPHLKETNERMEQTLLQLRPENSDHKALAMGVTCDDILKELKKDNLRILIDSGALMLELDNEQVAQRWLEIDPGIEAAVYFSKDNELMVKSKSQGTIKTDYQEGRGETTAAHQIPDVPFELSPFQGKLESCGVFLDDQHTRGTDVKFPLDSKACVTIGSRMRREKLIQACMRMRKLGNGHSVIFYLSHEAKDKVTGNGTAGTLSASSILNWVKQNTKEFNDEGLLYWSIASKNYAQRLAAEDIFHYPNWREPMHAKCYNDVAKANILAEQCVDQEITTLMEMYGQHSKLDYMTNLISKWFESAKKKLILLSRTNLPPSEIMSRFDEIHQAVRDRCHQHVPQKRLLSSSANMDEEQEKELELEKEAEVEEERKVKRPPKVVPVKPFLHPNVVLMVLYGESFEVVDGVMRLSDIFKDTTFAGEVQPDDWAVEVYATNDFISVIDPSYLKQFKTDSYLRPMEYFVSNEILYETTQILFLSPYEVNELLPQIRNRGFAHDRPLHMFAARKFEKQNMLLNVPRLRLPPAVVDSFRDKYRILESASREMAAMFLASGSLYFNNKREQDELAKFLSLVPKPWTPKFRKLFDAGKITPSGFLVPEFRQKQKTVSRRFQKDPSGMAIKVLMCRHQVVSDVAHVVRLLNEKKYVRLKKKEDDEESDEDP